MSTIVVVSGGFDPVHKGHIALFESAKALGDKLVVALNSDKWLQRKKGRSFMLFEERRLIVRNLKMVDDVFSFTDNDNTAIDRLASNIYSGIDNYDAGSKRFKQVKKAMDNAFNLFNGDFPNSSTDTQAFLVQEDPEMIDRSISAIKIELEVATAALTEMSQVVDIPVKEAQMHLAEITSRLGTSQQEYNWYSTRYAALKQEYDAAFGLLAPQQAPQAEQQRKGK